MLKTIGAVILCLWAADFFTGFAHWLEDTYCLEHLPLVGKFICEPNIQHHIDPRDIIREGTFFSGNILQWTVCSILFLVLACFGQANIYTFLTLFFTSFGNEVHRWNHCAKSAPVVSFIKETGLIQMQRQHALHHKPPYAQELELLRRQVDAEATPEGVRPKIAGDQSKSTSTRHALPLDQWWQLCAPGVSREMCLQVD